MKRNVATEPTTFDCHWKRMEYLLLCNYSFPKSKDVSTCRESRTLHRRHPLWSAFWIIIRQPAPHQNGTYSSSSRDSTSGTRYKCTYIYFNGPYVISRRNFNIICCWHLLQYKTVNSKIISDEFLSIIVL